MRKILKSLGLLAPLIAGTQLSPKPGVTVIRTAFDRDAAKVARALEQNAPEGIVEETEIQYASGSPVKDKGNTTLDIVRTSKNKDEKLPVLIWAHGGGWISGKSWHVNPYLKYIVSDKVAAVSLNYSLAPERKYPTQVEQINIALKFLKEHQDKFNLDMSQVILAGDSAGSQLTSQIAAITTNPEFAQECNIVPALEPEELKGVILQCGVYDLPRLLGSKTGSKIVNWGFKQEAWALTGTKNDNLEHDTLQAMSTIYHVTEDFPPVLISGGNGDGFTNPQSKRFATELEKLGVKVTRIFFDNADPELPHEYQFKLEFPEAKEILHETINWIDERLNTHLS
ncbi:MAG: alpha/beta hydrolase [Micrococcaceae bacterium]